MFKVLFLLFLTSSFDLILNLKIGGFSLRFTYCMVLLVSLVAIVKMSLNNFRVRKVLGGTPLLIWTLFLVAFIPNTTFLPRNIGYVMWHLMHLAFIFSFCFIIKTERDFIRVFKLYIYSFMILAIFGFIQFVLGIIGVDIFISQWWLPGLPRINGFCYEPSYFGTYLLLGWCIIAFLNIKPNHLFSKKNKIWLLVLMTFAIILTSSRMSIIAMVILLLLYSMFKILKTLKTLRTSKKFLLFWSVFLTVLVLSSITLVKHLHEVQFLFNGLGVGNASTHSIDNRKVSQRETFQVFLKSPLLGVSLGGIPSAKAALNGVQINSNEEAKVFEGANVFAEILAASGLIGFLFFLWYFGSIIFTPQLLIRKYQKRTSDDLNAILIALIIAFIAEIAILTFNQNICRPYLWIHIAMITSAYQICRLEIIKKTDLEKIGANFG